MSASKIAPQRPRRPLLSGRLWLCAAMLFVQMLGLVHGLSHGQPAPRQAQTPLVQGQPGLSGQRLAPATPQVTDAAAALDLFAGHHDSFKCRLLDHLADHGATAPVMAQLEPATPRAIRSEFRGERLATRLIAAFQARGPPTRT